MLPRSHRDSEEALTLDETASEDDEQTVAAHNPADNRSHDEATPTT